MGNRTVEITEANFKDTIEKGGITVLDFWAEWCGPCKAFAPTFEKAAEKHADVTFGKVNTDVEQGLAGAFEIRSIPTIMVFRDRVLLFAQPGALPEPALEELLRQVKALDMEQVHKEIAEREKQAAQQQGAQPQGSNEAQDAAAVAPKEDAKPA